ncbi:MAG: T9SS type A sorting domain-containing protein [Saprospiraceae bacterium]|nr:T9SS type A sorting domain-containing protein [Saprospiraceae bacterium]
MSIKKCIISTILLCLMSGYILHAQHQPCGQDHVTRQWFMKKPEMQKMYERHVDVIRKNLSEKKNDSPLRNEIKYTIPVVFHILHQGGTENISEEQIKDQMRILNRDYQKLNADTALVVSAFKNNIAHVGFAFELAKIDPEGNCTNGIVRHYTSKTIWDADKIEDFIYSWPTNQYLNIYVVKSINIAPAYTFLPGVGIPDFADVIVCQSNLIGSIGTAGVANSRALTHEVGHWFGLPHIWGVSNAPGVTCGDDFVPDTPITKGFISCSINNSKICDPNIEENVQNYMDYTPCKLMFTNGQAAYMIETITLGLNDRDYLVSEENNVNTGIKGNSICNTIAAFTLSKSNICIGDSLKLTNFSTTGNDNSSLLWTMYGGIPESSTDSVVTVRFPEPGEYSVELIVNGGINGNDTLIRFVTVEDGNNGKRPNFEFTFANGILPNDINVTGTPADEIGWISLDGPGAENTKGCIFLNNISSELTSGHKDYFETPYFDLSNVEKPRFSYYYAYAKKFDNQNDSFKVEYTLDCGQTWKNMNGIPGTNSMSVNTGGVTSEIFIPQAEQWKKVSLASVFTTPIKNKPSVKFRFLFKSDPAVQGSNNIYIDEINILDETATKAEEVQWTDAINLYPNPSGGEVEIRIPYTSGKTAEVFIVNLTGMIVDKPRFIRQENEYVMYKTDSESRLSSGIYFVKIHVDGYPIITKKMLVIDEKK